MGWQTVRHDLESEQQQQILDYPGEAPVIIGSLYVEEEGRRISFKITYYGEDSTAISSFEDKRGQQAKEHVHSLEAAKG